MNEAGQKRQHAEAIGRRSEWLASIYLSLKGFSILARRFKSHSGEIDLIAKRGDLIAFVEVKARKNLDDAIIAVGAKNRQRISAAASMFLAKNVHLANCDMRYDIIAVSGWRIRHLKAAWREGD